MTSLADVAEVRLAGGTWRDDLRGVWVVWRRELVRFRRSRLRIITSLAQPVGYLFVLGTGLSSVVRPGATAPGVDYRTFMFPGVIAMTVLFTAIFSAVSIVWDREFGFLREMLVAPVRRGALITGKAAGGATVATIQGSLILLLAGLVNVPYSPRLLVTLLFEMALAAFVLTAAGILVASRIQQVESFQVVMQFFVLPIFFLSGALFPLHGLPRWLSFITKVDPLTYAVDPMRRAVLSHKNVPAHVVANLNPGVTWNGWRVPTVLELAVVVAAGVVMLTIAVVQFSRTE